VYQPLQDLLPYEDFALVLRIADLADLIVTLEGVAQERVLQVEPGVVQGLPADQRFA
jgi:hypothetical protein